MAAHKILNHVRTRCSVRIWLKSELLLTVSSSICRVLLSLFRISFFLRMPVTRSSSKQPRLPFPTVPRPKLGATAFNIDPDIIILSSDDESTAPQKASPSNKTKKQRGKAKAVIPPGEIVEIVSDDDAGTAQNMASSSSISGLQRQLDKLQKVSYLAC